MAFKIMTDTTADLPQEYIQANNLGVLFFNYIIKEECYNREKQLEVKEFYDLMRAGNMPTTSQVNPDQCKEYFEENLKENQELLFLCFSSALSGTYNSACIAAEMIMEEHPEYTIKVIDTKCASMGEGLLVHKALQFQKKGYSLEKTAEMVLETILHLVHVFTVDDLNHLYRGGRVNKATAIVGTMVGIKPVLHVDDEGRLIPVGKVRGRKKSLYALVDYMEKNIGKYRDDNDMVFISHGDALEDAEFVRDEVKSRFGINNFLINSIGPTIGAHSGPGTIAMFFVGESR